MPACWQRKCLGNNDPGQAESLARFLDFREEFCELVLVIQQEKLPYIYNVVDEAGKRGRETMQRESKPVLRMLICDDDTNLETG